MAIILQRDQGGMGYTPFTLDNEMVREPDHEWIALHAGTGLPWPESWITSATQDRKTDGRLPDNIYIRTTMFCSDRFKRFVERFEPGLHLFRPVDLKRKSGDRIGDFYAWSAGQDVDCLLTENLGEFWDLREPPHLSFFRAVTAAEYQQKYPDKGDRTRIDISAPAVKDRHLWMGGLLTHYGRGNTFLFMSDEMHVAYKKEKLTGLRFRCAVTEVDRPWIASQQMGSMLGQWEARENAIVGHWPDALRRHGAPAA